MLGSVDAGPHSSPSRWYIALLVCALLLGFVYKQRVDGIFACPARGYLPDSYLSDCRAVNYGDFDHGSFWYGLDARSRSAAATADVLFLGNSRMQFAFSGVPLQDWAAAHGVRPYLLGFSFTENVKFTGPVLANLKPRARAYVINVDRFFDDRPTHVMAEILHETETEDRYHAKQRWQIPHRYLCNAAPRACGNQLAVFRARDTGRWRILGEGEFRTVGIADGALEFVARWPQFATIGREFLATLPVPAECVFLTMVPSSQSRTAEARAISEALGKPLHLFEAENLQTFDGSHLDVPSAERWSAAFRQALGPDLARCARPGSN
jgi:hypothetical protein